MATLYNTMLPDVPVKHANFISHVAAHPDTPMPQLLAPFQQYDSKIREVFAQQPQNPLLADNHLNITPIFAGHEKDLKIRARSLAAESAEETDKYLMPLAANERKSNGAPAVVQSFQDFQTNFNLFSESSLSEMDWTNVVAAGSSVVTSLLPVPDEYSGSKRSLRRYYHDVVAPASDVDLFIYGLDEAQAIDKIRQIEAKIKDAILEETTTIRTKHAITIASQYPTRHVQIVLRIYKSVAEILTGFDVDCSCVAYDGKQVYASPRALAAYMTQVNTIDLSRRSPSYENRLSKYSHRGFEVHWPQMDRSRIDPTIFERNLARTLGLARLLVLEKLPTSTDRDSYMDQRRRERGRPPINRYNPYARALSGNIKDDHEDEVAEWVDEEEVSDYHTFTIPYGEKFHARKIEKLLYTKDLLLNAEWNKPKDREVHLHRHPAFFGDVDDVIHDCCGYCPKPQTVEEEEVAEKESKIYISGEISFIKDDPGRQTIGSFNPLTDDDWTEMAYVGNTARLCQAIVDGDLEHVQDWLAQEGSDPNCRDYTGRTPLQLACTSSTPEIVQALVDAGARMVARVADGRTALHIAAARGNVEMVKTLLIRSEQNEEEEAQKGDLRKQERLAAKKEATGTQASEDSMAEADEEDKDIDIVDSDDEDDDVEMKSATTGSYVKLKKSEEPAEGDNMPEDNDEEDPDVFDVNVLAWDTPCSPLHLAIVNGHCEVVKELVQNFGADVLLPVKLFHPRDKTPRAAILTLVLAHCLPFEKAEEMVRLLLDLGASPAQADMHGITALHRYAAVDPRFLNKLIEHDRPAAQRAVNHLSIHKSRYDPSPFTPLLSAIEAKIPSTVTTLLELGASPEIDFTKFMDAYLALHSDDTYSSGYNNSPEQNMRNFHTHVHQPIVVAVKAEMPNIALKLLDCGADPNTIAHEGWQVIEWEYRRKNSHGLALIDVVRRKLEELRDYKPTTPAQSKEPKLPFEGDGEDHITPFKDGSYQQWIAVMTVQQAIANYEAELDRKNNSKPQEQEGLEEKQQAINRLIAEFEEVEKALVGKGAKTFYELHPEIEKPTRERKNAFGLFGSSPDQKEKPFEVVFSFQVPNLDPKMAEGYIQLYEAAWHGDLSTIKKLTLSFWGERGDQFPLKIAVKDSRGASPFHIAVLRGHLETAKGILEISKFQYKPKTEEAQQRYDMADDESSQASETDDDDGGNIRLDVKILDDQFTIENVGEVATAVRSHTSPLEFFEWAYNVFEVQLDDDGTYSLGLKSHPASGEWSRAGVLGLLQYAIFKDDLNLLKTLLAWGNEYAKQYQKVEDGEQRFFRVDEADLTFAIRNGRTRCLAEIIKKTGSGIPLEELVKTSGVEVTEKPKYYQGLSVHGTKRADWAAAGREVSVPKVQFLHPPLLQAAKSGNLDSLELFLSDSPARWYHEFAEAHKEDKRVQYLAQAQGGLDKSIKGWLGTRRDLVLHCVIIADVPIRESIRLIKYIIDAVPKSLKTKSPASGLTPLHLAFRLGRYAVSRALIEAGADQTTRDKDGNNLLHTLLEREPYAVGDKEYRPHQLSKMVGLLDRRLLPNFVTERRATECGGSTPLSQWLESRAADSDRDVKMLNVILDFSPALEELEMVNGAGDTPLHIVFRNQHLRLANSILDRRPELLHRENATGRTPAEMAWDAHMSECFKDPPQLLRDPSSPWGSQIISVVQNDQIVNRSPEKFVGEQKGKKEPSRELKMWNMVKERMGSYKRAGQAKRKLVSLSEANEVARRLAKKQRDGMWTSSHDGIDEVETWVGDAKIWFENKKKDGEESDIDADDEARTGSNLTGSYRTTPSGLFGGRTRRVMGGKAPRKALASRFVRR
ncbi:ankyrin repeat protein [Phyllosticta paracitricarpa]|uniref:Ankyrin repeat protein n=1 Tax=Phyllosticta paracitricarpa TaxID=2016321 RepID=A0ABR1NGW2_9PEZI